MGLDNGFILRKRLEPGIYTDGFEVGYFRKFYELSDFIRQSSLKLLKEDGKETYKVTLDVLLTLQKEIHPIIEIIKKFTYEQLVYYDEVGLPDDFSREDYAALNYGYFNVFRTGTSFQLKKLMKLHHLVETLIEILTGDFKENLLITFYVSP